MFLASAGRKFIKNRFPKVDVGQYILLPGPLILMKKHGLAVLAVSLFILSGCQKKPAVAGVHINVVMKKYSIEPAVIHVKAGESVVLEVTSADVKHGLDIPALGIKEPVPPGETTPISFTAPAKGEYTIACGIVC